MKIIIVAVLVLAAHTTALAQQSPTCQAFYPLGVNPPSGCAKSFDQWGDGSKVAPSQKVDTVDPYVRSYFTPRAPVDLPKIRQ